MLALLALQSPQQAKAHALLWFFVASVKVKPLGVCVVWQLTFSPRVERQGFGAHATFPWGFFSR